MPVEPDVCLFKEKQASQISMLTCVIVPDVNSTTSNIHDEKRIQARDLKRLIV